MYYNVLCMRFTRIVLPFFLLEYYVRALRLHMKQSWSRRVTHGWQTGLQCPWRTASAGSAPQSCPPQTTTVKRTKIIQTPEHQKHPSHPLSSPQRKCNTNKLEAELNVPICTYFDLCNKGWTKELIGVLSAGKKREKTYTAVNIYRTLRFRL